jgi:Raf kinase inhibitor-like YbhB/YbcL family protein
LIEVAAYIIRRIATKQLFRLTGSGFSVGGIVPGVVAGNSSTDDPQLTIFGTPPGAMSLILILHSLDPVHGRRVHWTAWNIAARTPCVSPGKLPDGAVQGINDFGHTHYDGPYSSSSNLTFVFDLYALDTYISLEEGAPEEDVRLAVTNHAIAKAVFTDWSYAKNTRFA